jgi:hypothetical protein
MPGKARGMTTRNQLPYVQATLQALTAKETIGHG